MRWVRQAWFRVLHRELRDPIRLPDRDAMERAEWNAWIGRTGERLAGKTVERTGGKILWRNFRAKGGGEVDLIYRDGDTLVFAEVKTRTSEDFGRPGLAVNRAKQRLVIRGANAWLRELNFPELIFRFDVIEVVLKDGEVPEIRINESAFVTPQVGLGM